MFGTSAESIPDRLLDEAAQQAARLKSSDSQNAYRIIPAEDRNGFIVIKIPMQQVYAERWASLCGSLLKWFPAPLRARR
jgi:hypothetical protein